MPSKARSRQTRRRNKASSIKPDVLLDILALALFLLFIASVLVLLFPEKTGTTGQLIRDFIVGYLGLASYLVPIQILLIALTALPLKIRGRAGLWIFKFGILLFSFTLLLGSFGGGFSNAGGIVGGFFRELIKEPYLGIFYPIVTIAITVALLVLFTGRALIVPFLQATEKTLSEFSQNVREKSLKNVLVDETFDEEESEGSETISLNEEEANWEHTIPGSNYQGEDIEELSTKAKDSMEAPATKTNVSAETKMDARRGQLHVVPPSVDYRLPPIELLEDTPFSPVSEEALKRNASIIEKTLSSFNISVQVLGWEVGPRVTRFEAKIGPGININRLHYLADNLALELAVPAVRLDTPIPGKSAVGIEVPNSKFNKISLRALIESHELRTATHPLAFPVGRDLAGKPVIGNIHHMHHLLIAGSTGSGKSVCINSIIVSLLYRNTPATVRFILIDPKRVELSVFKEIPHLATPIVHTINEAQGALRWVVSEMENRLIIFEQAGARNIDGFNERASEEERLPYILLVVDELADLIKSAGPVFERLIARIAHLARATGIHLIVATQRPDTTVITGNIKMNIPSRISFAVVSQIDSRTILDMPGAEKLLGSGDMLYFPVGYAKPVRIQGAWVREDEVKRVADFVRGQAQPEYLGTISLLETEEELDAEETDSEELDPLYSQAYEIVISAGRASTSLLQRRLKIGYNRAARIMEQMERMGVVSPPNREGNRELLVPRDFEKGSEEQGRHL